MIAGLDQIVRKIEYEWSSKRLLVVGDVMLDKYVRGEVKRISPEAPVPVVLVRHSSHQPGGAANVAMNMARLGAHTTLIGFVGEDEDASLLATCLQANEIEPRLVSCSGFPTVSKLRILGARQQMMRLDHEREGERAPEEYARMIDTALAALADCDAVVLSDYAKGALSEDVCQAVICAANERGVPVLVDPKASDFSRYRGATTVCPNLAELTKALHVGNGQLEDLLAASEGLVTAHNLKFLTATLSERGIAIVYPKSRFVAPAQAHQVYDVSGAGDTVVAVLALSFCSGMEPEIAVQLANVAAGIVVGKVGTVPVEKHELMSALSTEMTLRTVQKVVGLDELRIRTALWKRNGARVVFTNGCFDLLHVGHVTLLEEARRYGDRLVVAINSDSSVRGLKGPTRPIVQQEDRARVLAALASVDAVVVFDEETPFNTILALQPDVLVKGGDYTCETVVGAREVIASGGQVKIVPTVEGFSTTSLVNKFEG